MENDREEQEMATAMALSMGETRPQETGVADPRNGYFGPARQDYHDANKWALLGQQEDQVVFETQRLMAFLDSTDRSYGSIEGLANLPELKGCDPDTAVKDYIELWLEAVQRKDPSMHCTLFDSVGVKLLTPTKEELSRLPFTVLDLKEDHAADKAAYTLYDALDDMIWEGHTDANETVVYLESVGDIFPIRLARPASAGRGIAIPAIWYPDRYLAEAKDQTMEIKKQRDSVEEKIKEMDEDFKSPAIWQQATG
ncbi:MAG: hypothetical protein M1826_005497 [Phylliscum demangeonii]|nr:MAG: hypothetical protein M1826_005497 [Phylliscum demangeonii]